MIRTASQWVRKGTGSPVKLTLDLPEDIPIQGFSGQLHQVFLNLLENAMDAVQDGENGSEVKVVASLTETEAYIAIQDDGPGLDPDQIPHLFEPFYSTKPPGEGTGLGLYIAYGIVSEHGGSLQAANRKGGGAELSMTLPLDAP